MCRSRPPLRAAGARRDGCAILMMEKQLMEKLRTPSLGLLILSMALFPVLSGCASEERVNALEQRIRNLESQQSQQVAQQQQSMESISRLITAFNEETGSINQRLAALSENDNQLSLTDSQISQQVSELESRLDERMINRVLATPWKYLGPGIAILLAGIAIGVWGRRIWHFVSGTEQ